MARIGWILEKGQEWKLSPSLAQYCHLTFLPWVSFLFGWRFWNVTMHSRVRISWTWSQGMWVSILSWTFTRMIMGKPLSLGFSSHFHNLSHRLVARNSLQTYKCCRNVNCHSGIPRLHKILCVSPLLFLKAPRADREGKPGQKMRAIVFPCLLHPPFILVLP